MLYLCPVVSLMKRYSRILIHALAWMLFLLYEWIFKQGVLNNPEASIFQLKIVLVRVAALMPAVYLTICYLVPKLFYRAKKFQFFGACIALVAADTLLMKTLTYFLVLKGVPGFAPTFMASLGNLTGWLVFMGNISLNLSFVLMIFFINKSLEDERKRQALEAAKREAELQLLKSQVQPHFIFNTLNNIYSLSKSGAANTTTEMIYRLSDVLEYMLYDSSKEWVPVKREITYIENYLNLEKIRFGSRLDISLNVYGEMDQLEIPPLVLLPFVENSFKHGLSGETGNCWIRVDVELADEYLTMKVENSKQETQPSFAVKGGIGLSNVRKRLEIMMENDFEIGQSDGGHQYLASVRLKPRKITGKYEQKIEVPGD